MNLGECKVLLTGSEGGLGQRVKKLLMKNSVRGIVYYDLALGDDVLHAKRLRRAGSDCNVTIHQAGLAHPGLAPVDKYLWTNTIGSLVALEEAIRNRHSRLVFVSSGAVYGWDLPDPPPLAGPITEEHRLALEATEAYTTSKVISEQILSLYAKAGLIDVVILRLAPIWNPGEEPEERFASSAVSPDTAAAAVVNAVRLDCQRNLSVYNVADPGRNGGLCIDRALADGIIATPELSATV